MFLMFHPPYFLLFLCLISCDFSCGKLEKRIIGGKDAPADKFPWAVSIRGEVPDKPGATNVCGATLINNQWLLTAAHCFWSKGGAKVSDYRDPKNWHIIAGQVFVEANRYLEGHQDNQQFPKADKSPKPGIIPPKFQIPSKPDFPPKFEFPKFSEEKDKFDDFINQFEKDFRNMFKKFGLFEDKKWNKRASPPTSNKEDHFHVVKIILHPKYQPDDIEWDIALMKLNKPIPNTIQVKSVSLPTSNEKNRAFLPKDKEKCILVGWGCTKGGGNAVSRAQFTQLEIVNFDKCNKVYNGQAGLNKEHEFCAGFINKNIGICPGDSGGGLICTANSKYYVAGVTSATHRDRPGSYPGLFTRVSYFTDWIGKTMSAN